MERELIFGTIRHYPSLLKRVETRLAKPLRNKDQDLMMLLLVGAYQLKYTNMPQHAIINETVQGAIELRKPWAKGLSPRQPSRRDRPGRPRTFPRSSLSQVTMRVYFTILLATPDACPL